MYKIESSQEVNLLNGQFLPNEAQKLICSSIKTRVNEAKLEYLQKWVKNHSTNSRFCEELEDQLTHQERETLKLIERARYEGKRLEISTTIHVRICEDSN